MNVAEAIQAYHNRHREEVAGKNYHIEIQVIRHTDQWQAARTIIGDFTLDEASDWLRYIEHEMVPVNEMEDWT